MRRVVLLDGEHLAGIVTLDDLVVAEPVDTLRLAEVIIAQLAAPAPRKPAGVLHPGRGARPSASPRSSAERRHAARVIQTSHRAARLCADLTGLEDFEQAMTALEVVAGGVARRLMPSEAGDLLAQLPSELRERLLDAVPAGPERSLTRENIELELSRRLDIDESRAAELVDQIGTVLEHLVSDGEIADVRAQLPADMKSIFRGEVAHRTP